MKPSSQSWRFRCSFVAILLVPLGLGMILLGAAVPFVVSPGSNPWLAFAMLSLPTLATGSLCLLNGIAAVGTRIAIDANGVLIRAPTWRGAPFPPMRTFSANWREVTTVQRRVEVYQLLGLPFSVDVHRVCAGERCVILGGRTVRGLARAMEEIGERAGCPLLDRPVVEAKLWTSLRREPPAWPE